jgi:dihydrofolate reductase
MRTIYFAASTLDGFIADKDDNLDWLFQFGEPKDQYIERFVETVGALAMGSRTYQWMLDHMAKDQKWPYGVPTFVFSTRALPSFPGADVRFVKGDVRPVHAEMVREARGKNVWIVGGGELVGKFHDAELLDELAIQIVSTTLGSGAPVFPRHLKKPLKLLDVRRLDQEFVELRYSAR